MIYTVRYAHLKEAPKLRIGDMVKSGDVIGIMGSSGQSTATHLHIDCVEGLCAYNYTLEAIEGHIPISAPRQLNHFIDRDLFDTDILITTPYACPEYMKLTGKVHSAYDVVPADRHITEAHYVIKWGRSMTGKVIRVAYDPLGYGHNIQIAFDA